MHSAGWSYNRIAITVNARHKNVDRHHATAYLAYLFYDCGVDNYSKIRTSSHDPICCSDLMLRFTENSPSSGGVREGEAQAIDTKQREG